MVTRASTSSLRRKRASRANSAVSTSRAPAQITNAPRAAIGNPASSPRPSSRVSPTAASATSEYSWLRAPSESAMVVRLPLLLTGKPCIEAAAMFAAPSASSSPFASTG